MNKFVTRSQVPKPAATQSKKSNKLQPEKENIEKTNESNGQVENSKQETPLEFLHNAIKSEEAEVVYKLLTKSRPFEEGMNKTITNLQFSSKFSDPQSEVLLFSVDEEVVKAYENGQSLSFRGEETENIVLCTEEATYPIKMIETSISILVSHRVIEEPLSGESYKFETKEINGKCVAYGVAGSSLDILNIGSLKDYLHEFELNWNWREKGEKLDKGYKTSELLERIQLSKKELQLALEDLPVVKLRSGRHRYLSHNFRQAFLHNLVECLDNDDIEDISMEKVTKDSLKANLSENVPDEVVDWFLTRKCQKNGDFFSIDETKLIRDCATAVLVEFRKIPYENFLNSLSKLLPFELRYKIPANDGLFDFSDSVSGKMVTYLGVEDLPDNIRER